MQQNKKARMIWGIIVVVAIIFIVIFAMRPNKMDVKQSDTNTAAEVEGTEDTTDGSVTTTTKAPVITYQQALTKYKDRRIQLGTGQLCSATPNNVTYKNNTNIMLDNRSAQTRSIKLGGYTYSIKGYGFKIVNLYSSKLPVTWLMDCGTQQNVATILLQK